jgi:hypothetical protein
MTESNTDEFGSKKITTANWQEPDEQAALWRQMTAVAKTEEEWVGFFLQPRLNPSVPAEIKKLLEVARAAMIYSWYYYPLATLGMEQCYRLLDTGTRLRCEQAGISTKTAKKDGTEIATTFKENVTALMSKNIISPVDAQRWEAIRNLRNSSSHPKYRAIFDPGQAEGMMSSVVESLNELFR